MSCSHNLYPLVTMLCSSRCRSRLRSVGDLVETGQPMKRPAKKLVESGRFGSSISMLSALRSPLPVLRSPILILVQNLPCLKCFFSSVLNSRSSLHNLCFYLRSVLRVLHEYKIQINAQCKAFKAPLNICTSA